VVRIDASRRLRKSALIAFVMDDPVPIRPGFLVGPRILYISRLFAPTRRIYVVRIDDGSQAADTAAAEAAKVLGVNVERGRFWSNKLRLD